MRATKKVEFNQSEIESATRDALVKLSAQIIGEPKEDEEYTFEMCSWRNNATVEIIKKVVVSDFEKEPNQHVSEPIRSILKNAVAL